MIYLFTSKTNDPEPPARDSTSKTIPICLRYQELRGTPEKPLTLRVNSPWLLPCLKAENGGRIVRTDRRND